MVAVIKLRPLFLRLAAARRTCSRSLSTTGLTGARRSTYPCKSRVAVLYQALDPPIINGVQKPRKPGGYRDSGADIASNLSRVEGVDVICPTSSPRPETDADWCFPDTEEGILQALDQGATHLWANTILFAGHPLQTSVRVGTFQDKKRVVGQGPLAIQQYDDKEYVNDLLRRAGGFTMPRSWTVHDGPDFPTSLRALSLPFPVVAKPIRGRGSHGVRVCGSFDELLDHARTLFDESPAIMLEEFLAGEEATVTVMPPTTGDKKDYWALPVVTRFNHVDGVAPYSGVAAVASNSRAVTEEDMRNSAAYAQVVEECERAASLLRVAAPIRTDVRRREGSPESEFALFDVNMKPNMTGPGRPGRDDQASLTLIAAAALGWDYRELLSRILMTSSTLRTLRSLEPVECER
ncbi:hypothetical protein C8A01DRAFT_45415 [Parachaetomium inaequale]|uniref:ATP-grasp domain-containing protein n=1 Tax=Parachaetomium inaequale TaxID=2588326 RepID=A0AAN6PIE9_9PEZI|nr:hypothetical protein C8A01DRAFT_45415 [Parachaetomium inaequale]